MLLIKHNSSDSGFRLHPSLRKHQCYDTKLNSSCKNTEEAGSGARMGLYAIQSSSRSKGKQFLIVFKKFFCRSFDRDSSHSLLCLQNQSKSQSMRKH